MSAGLVLVVDDEPQILRALTTNLRGAGYDVERAATGEEALAAAAARPPDAVVLDLILPDVSGVEVCRELRTWSETPILILSAVGEEEQKVSALDAGADDYVTKPFGMGELLARLRAAMRRAAPAGGQSIAVGGLVVDFDRHQVTVDGRPVTVTRIEFDLLSLFVRNEGKLLTHRAILREVWGPAYQIESHYLHVYASRLRGKIEADPRHPRYLITEPGAGYRLVRPE
ncbi:MAG TPA: response regulator transcription factor [Gaiellales bacterium]|nr:response regulator transcription factor [Gaiellales bacterium]